MYNIGINKRLEVKIFFDLLPVAAGKRFLRFVEKILQTCQLLIRNVIHSVQPKADPIDRRCKAKGTAVILKGLKF